MKAWCSTCGMVHTTHNNKHGQCVTLLYRPRPNEVSTNLSIPSRVSQQQDHLCSLSSASWSSLYVSAEGPVPSSHNSPDHKNERQVTAYSVQTQCRSHCIILSFLSGLMLAVVHDGKQRRLGGEENSPYSQRFTGIWMCIRTHFLIWMHEELLDEVRLETGEVSGY